MGGVATIRRWGLLISGNCLLLFALLSAIELGLSTLYRLPPPLDLFRSTARQYYRRFELRVVSFDPDCARYDRQVSYLLRPGECTFSNREFSTTVQANSRGLRDDEESLSRPAIIAVGDSFTMGWGVEQHEAFPDLIEQATRRKVLNAGIPSFATAREFILLESLDTSALEALIIQYNPNDVTENASQQAADGQLPIMKASEYYEAQGEQRIKLQADYYFGKYLREYLPLLVDRYRRHGLEKGPKTKNHEETVREVDAFLSVLASSKLNLASVPVYVIEVAGYNRNDEVFFDELSRRAPPRLVSFGGMPIDLHVVRTDDLLVDDDYFRLDSHLRTSGHKKLAKRLASLIAPPP